MMKVLSAIELACYVAKKANKPVLFISFPFNDDANYFDVLKAAPYLSIERDTQAIYDGYAVILCDSVEEQERLYNQTVGDDGPTKLNKYNGPARVYALTIDRTGQTLNENT
jgi:hypothetical protein